MSDWTFFRRVMIAGAVVVLGLVLWKLADALLLLFGIVLVGLVLSNAAEGVTSYTRLPRVAALLLVVLLLVGVVAGVGMQFGSQINLQFTELWQRLPGAIDNFEQRLGLGDISGQIWQQAQSNTGSILSQITSWAGLALGIVGNVVMLLVGGIFFAADPDLYRRGALKLVPPSQRPQVEETLDFSSAALRQWLLGQLLAMLLVGSAMTAGAIYLGLPSPLALGFAAGLGEFIPFAGPLVASVLAILLALTQSWTQVGFTLVLIAVVQVLESNIITPLIQQRMVSLPPVVTLFAIFSLGLLFGPLGVLFGTPLAVFLFVAVNRLYVRGLLEEPTEVPGEKQVREEKLEEIRA